MFAHSTFCNSVPGQVWKLLTRLPINETMAVNIKGACIVLVRFPSLLADCARLASVSAEFVHVLLD
jgi:hypothetical protein